MKINKKTDLAIQILLYLRNNNIIEPTYTSANLVSEQLGISYNHLRKIIVDLNSIGFINTKLGKNGGITLSQTYDRVSLKTLLVAMEEFELNKNVINCNTCNITTSCKFDHITHLALVNFYNTYEHLNLNDL